MSVLILFLIVEHFIIGIMILTKDDNLRLLGYPAERIKDKAGLSKWMGTNLMLLGCLITLQYFSPNILSFLGISSIGTYVNVIFVIVYFLGLYRLSKGNKQFLN
ncbi:MAG: hypothetical protein WCI30_04430 [Clostridia bacterium]